jgi:uncharacterized delta-60 repeat protein
MLVSVVTAAIAAAPTIYHQPQSQTVILYQPAAFSVETSGTAPLWYQWRKDGVPIDGATTNQLVFAHSQFADAGLYSVVVSNALSSVTSVDARLTVNTLRSGDLDFAFPLGSSIDSYVHAFAVQPDGKVLIGGHFYAVNGAARGKVARLNADGTTDATFMNGLSGPNYGVTSITLQSDGRMFIGGYFTTVNGMTRSRIARLNADGSLDNSFLNGLSGVNFFNVSSIVVQTDGKVLIGGRFSMVNGVSHTNFARLNLDGTLDTNFQSAASLSNGGSVNSIVMQNDGKVLIGGAFTNVNGVARKAIARLNPDGTVDSGFNGRLSEIELSGFNVPPSFIEPTVDSVALQGDGKTLIAGNFTTANSSSPDRIVRLNADGSLDASFKSSPDGAVNALAVQSGGKILIAGQFTKVNGVSRNSIARLNSDGTLDAGFQNGLSGVTWNSRAARVESLAVQSDGKVLIGGDFWTVNGAPATYFARLWGADLPPLVNSVNRHGADVNLNWYAISNRTYRVQYNGNLSATNWTDLAGDVSAASATASKTDSTLSNASLRFYRVVLLP